MVDVSKTIQPKSDQLNADDLIGGSITVEITNVSSMAQPDQPIAISYKGDNGKPWKPCKSMRRVLVMVWGKDGKQYIGRMLTLYRDPGVLFGGVAVGGIRISHMSHIDKETTMALTASKANRKPFTVKPLKAAAALPAPAQPAADPAVIAEGDAAAGKGAASYSAWLASLTPEVKETVRGQHNRWAGIAKAFDAAQQPAEPEPSSEDDGPAM